VVWHLLSVYFIDCSRIPKVAVQYISPSLANIPSSLGSYSVILSWTWTSRTAQDRHHSQWRWEHVIMKPQVQFWHVNQALLSRWFYREIFSGSCISAVSLEPFKWKIPGEHWQLPGVLPLGAPIVQKVDSAIHRINFYPVDSEIWFRNSCPLDSDLSGG